MKFPTTILLCGALAVAASPTSAQQKCAPHAEMSAWLLNKFQEHPVARGLSNEGNLTEVFASAEGTWTVLITAPGGPSCIISAGESWSMESMPLPGDDA